MVNQTDAMSQMGYQLDQNGEEILLKDDKYQVMMEWEKPYMEACIDALKPSGDVLEIGFGCGYSATHIQKYHPKSHTIVEYHPVVIERARPWAEKHPSVRLVHDTWQHALSSLGIFDVIFFDDYPLESGSVTEQMEENSSSSQLLLSEGNKLLNAVENEIPFLKKMRYSDADLAYFLQEIGQQPLVEPKFYFRFLFDLENAGQISSAQRQFLLERLEARGMASISGFHQFVAEQVTQAPSEMRGDRLFEFLELCLAKHMRKGSRFSCYLNDPTSKFEDPKFLSKIILNPSLDYTEKVIPIKVPAHCGYYKGNTALVITVTKLSD